ncbi:MAG: hypothetical protein WCI19_08750 [Betaproteobacteria bacterium]|jgi:hypothetical protein|nr:hypothetical protein [Rhodocyclales bacterium]
MAVDALMQSLVVNPAKDSQNKARRDQRRDGQAEHKGEQGHENVAQPQLNAYGQIIGKTINTTA